MAWDLALVRLTTPVQGRADYSKLLACCMHAGAQACLRGHDYLCLWGQAYICMQGPRRACGGMITYACGGRLTHACRSLRVMQGRVHSSLPV